MFIPGETIVHQFHIPFTGEEVDKIIVTYYQNDRIILNKTAYPIDITQDATGTNSQFSVELSQEESLLFDDGYSYTVQLNVLFTSGSRCSSVEIKGENGIQHYREVVR